MPKPRILLVDDDVEIHGIAQTTMERNGFSFEGAWAGADGLRAVAAAAPSLILLDLMLPDMDGLEVCRRLKAEPAHARIPLIMLTAKDEELDIVLGLKMGADDYVAKPFNPRVLVARIHAVLRRHAQPDDAAADLAPLRIHGISIDTRRHEVRFRGAVIALTHMEFGILHVLAKRPGWVFQRYQIVDALRGADHAVTERTVDVQISNLRRKLGAAAEYIETIRGVGYRMRE